MALNAWHIGINHNRRNLAVEGKQVARSVVIGAYTAQGAGITLKSHEAAKNGVLNLALEATQWCPRGTLFSSMSIAHDSQVPAHRDARNDGLSASISFGSFRGGELIMEDPHGKKRIELPDGTSLPARVLHSKNRWVTFPAQQWHAVLPFQGTRWSLSIYCCKSLHLLPPADLRQLLDWGFRLPAGVVSRECDGLASGAQADHGSTSTPTTPRRRRSSLLTGVSSLAALVGTGSSESIVSANSWPRTKDVITPPFVHSSQPWRRSSLSSPRLTVEPSVAVDMQDVHLSPSPPFVNSPQSSTAPSSSTKAFERVHAFDVQEVFQGPASSFVRFFRAGVSDPVSSIQRQRNRAVSVAGHDEDRPLFPIWAALIQQCFFADDYLCPEDDGRGFRGLDE
eukprot:6489977-Amphidinium_carterae.3